MSVTPGLGAFNKDKVANKFGIQLKNKDTNKPNQPQLTPTMEKKILNTETSSTVIKNKTVSDFRVTNQSNGFQLNTNLSKSPESTIKDDTSQILNENKSDNIEHLSTPNVNHSTHSNTVKTDEIIRSNSQLLSNINPRSSLTPTTDRSKSPSPSLIKRTSIPKTIEQPISPISNSKRLSIPTTKTEAEIEHQKDQPLYKRQLSKTLDNASSTSMKNKHPYELPNSR